MAKSATKVITQTISITEAVARTGMAADTLRRYVSNGKIRAFWVGNKIMVSIPDVNKLVEDTMSKPQIGRGASRRKEWKTISISEKGEYTMSRKSRVKKRVQAKRAASAMVMAGSVSNTLVDDSKVIETEALVRPVSGVVPYNVKNTGKQDTDKAEITKDKEAPVAAQAEVMAVAAGPKPDVKEYTVQDIVDLLGLGRPTVSRLLTAKILRGTRNNLTGLWSISRRDFNDFCNLYKDELKKISALYSIPDIVKETNVPSSTMYGAFSRKSIPTEVILGIQYAKYEDVNNYIINIWGKNDKVIRGTQGNPMSGIKLLKGPKNSITQNAPDIHNADGVLSELLEEPRIKKCIEAVKDFSEPAAVAEEADVVHESRMQKIADSIGMELNRVFSVTGGAIVKLTETGCFVFNCGKFRSDATMLGRLVLGDVRVVGPVMAESVTPRAKDTVFSYNPITDTVETIRDFDPLNVNDLLKWKAGILYNNRNSAIYDGKQKIESIYKEYQDAIHKTDTEKEEHKK